MPDREKVIQGLEVVRNAIVDGYIHEPDQAVNAITDALALLKEQEAVEPKHNPLSPTDWFCGKCGMCISRFHNYCPSCGQEVRWE